MSQSLSQIYLHLIFATKNREDIILPDFKERLFAYMAGTLKSMQCPALVIGGTSNHVHILLRLNKTVTVSDLVRKLKSHSTLWLKETFQCQFAWRDGYGIFSVSQSKVETVRQYIENQEEHHKKISSLEEYKEFLRKHNIDFDERYI